jgi:hypothetical protein
VLPRSRKHPGSVVVDVEDVEVEVDVLERLPNTLRPATRAKINRQLATLHTAFGSARRSAAS